MSDEEFWEEWIADTPEEDEEYSGCGWVVLLVVLVVVAGTILAML